MFSLFPSYIVFILFLCHSGIAYSAGYFLPGTSGKYLSSGMVGSSDIKNPNPLDFNPALIGSSLSKELDTMSLFIEASPSYNILSTSSSVLSFNHQGQKYYLNGFNYKPENPLQTLFSLHAQSFINEYSLALSFSVQKSTLLPKFESSEKFFIQTANQISYGGNYNPLITPRVNFSGLKTAFGISYIIGNDFPSLKGLKFGFSSDMHFGLGFSDFKALAVDKKKVETRSYLAITEPLFLYQPRFGLLYQMPSLNFGLSFAPQITSRISGEIKTHAKLNDNPEMIHYKSFSSKFVAPANLKLSIDAFLSETFVMRLGVDVSQSESPSLGKIAPSEQDYSDIEKPESTILTGIGFEYFFDLQDKESVYSGLFVETPSFSSESYIIPDLIDNYKIGFGLGNSLQITELLTLSFSYSLIYYKQIQIIDNELKLNFYSEETGLTVKESNLDKMRLNLERHFLSVSLLFNF